MSALLSFSVFANDPSTPTFADAAKEYADGSTYGAFVKAAPLSRQGDPEAQALVGRLYLKGQGTVKHFATARVHYERSASAKYAPGMFMFAQCLLHGIGGAKDPMRATQLLESAASLGYPYAMLELSNATGDPAAAYRWASLAVKVTAGNEWNAALQEATRKRVAETSAKLDADKKRAEDKAVAAWKAAPATNTHSWTAAAALPFDLADVITEARSAAQTPKKDPTVAAEQYFPKN
jgi:TPR repeat protein